MSGEGALAGVKVLDLSRVLAGPWATQLLGDLGAEVIKIEKPGEGDETRRWGPPYHEGATRKEAAYFLSTNRNKASVAIDMAKPEGAELVRRLAASSDVLIENFKVGALKRYGLDYDSVAKVNPRLVYCSITGFGQQGPYSDRPGYDFVVQGMGGLMSVTGAGAGEPMKAGVALADILTGLYASNAILAALHHRDHTGDGQHIDMALLDVQVATLANQALNYLVSGKAPGRMGNAHPNIVPYQTFHAADAPINIAVGADAQYRRMCEVLGVPELGADPRYATNAGRVKHRAELVPQLDAAFKRKPTAEWVEALAAANVPAGPVNTVDQVFADAHVQHRGLSQTIEDKDLGPTPTVACPIKMSKTPPKARRAPPGLGADTWPVLAERLGLEAGELERLAGEGLIGGR